MEEKDYDGFDWKVLKEYFNAFQKVKNQYNSHVAFADTNW